MAVQLRVIITEDDIRKLVLPSGIPDTVEELLTIISKAFQLQCEIGLLYEDKDFGNQFFTVTSTADLHDKATVKVMKKEPVIILNMHPLDESAGSTSSLADIYHADDGPPDIDGCTSSSSQDTIVLPMSFRSAQWPVPFQVPQFSRDIEIILAEANKLYHASGTLFRDPSVKSAIMHDLANVIFSYTAYPSSQQILKVAEALVEKFPCLKEPGSFAGLYGWQQRIKYKMHNHRAKLRTRKYAYPEIEVNTLKRKQQSDATPAKNVKKAKKAEVNYLPPHPTGENQDTLEKERLELINEVQKKNNAKIITEKMSKTFSSRRLEVVTLSPSISVLKERWPALFTELQVKEEFRRITTVSLQETFMRKLDGYTPRLLELMHARGGAVGSRMRPLLDLFLDCQYDELEDPVDQAIKLLVIHNSTADQDAAEVIIVIEGNQVLSRCGNRTTACMLLMGLIYALNLEYPKMLKNTFEVFQKLLLELDGGKLLKKVQTLKNKLLE